MSTKDISFRGKIFRDYLIDEFRIEENLGFDDNKTPTYSTSDLVNSAEPQLFRDFLLKSPHQLVRFKIFKRSMEPGEGGLQDGKATKLIHGNRYKKEEKFSVSTWALWLTTRPWFDAVIFFFILLSTVIQGVQTQLDKAQAPFLYDMMDVFDDISLVVFSIEIIVKWLYSFEQFWYDGWNVFDFAATLLSAIPRILFFFLGAQGNFASVGSQLRLFRTMRVLKMVARVQTLRLVITAAIEAFSALGFILLLLLLLTYMFGIFSINLFYPYTSSLQEDLIYQDKFKDLPNAFITLFQLLTLDQWYAIQADIQKVVSPVVVISFFIFWVWIGAFVFRNVFVGVMVRKFDDIHSEVRKSLEAKRKKEQKKRALQKLQKQLADNTLIDSDSDESSENTEDELFDETTIGESSYAASDASQLNLFASKQHMKSAQRLNSARDLGEVKESMDKWVNIVSETLDGLKDEQKEYIWPRDSLFKYFQAMEQLQNNMREYQDLQYLASVTLVNLCEQN